MSMCNMKGVSCSCEANNDDYHPHSPSSASEHFSIFQLIVLVFWPINFQSQQAALSCQNL